MINWGIAGCQIELKIVEGGPETRKQAKKRRKFSRTSPPGQEENHEKYSRLVSAAIRSS